jgi:hypothetical protein
LIRRSNRGLRPRIGGCHEVRSRRSIESGPTLDHLADLRWKEESQEDKCRWFCLHERSSREPKWHPSQIYLCKTADARLITQGKSSQLKAT